MKEFDLKKAVEEEFPAYQENLATLVAIDSSNAPADGKMPFGAGVQKVLEAATTIAKGMGFKTHIDPEGYYAYAEIGEGEELFGILGHLDVVPAGDESSWDHPPFELLEKDGYFYGRGTQDDKGPTLASMHALKILLDRGAKLTKRVRFIFGADEETLWHSIKAYVKKEEHPTMGFTPDADFPLLYAEKGLVEYNLVSDEKTDINLQGGTAYNAVPATAFTPYDEKVESALKDLGYKYKVKDDKIEVIGKTTHAMIPEEGVNAAVQLAEAMVKAGKSSNLLKFIAEKGTDPLGTKIFGEVTDEVSGHLKFNLGILNISDKEQMAGVDIRFPVTYDKEKVDKVLQEVAKPYGVKVEPFDYLKSIYIDVKSDFVQSLMKAYQDVTGDMKSEPISTGGATFARSMDNIIAFGATLPGEKSTEHETNERAVVKSLKTAMEVYIRAFQILVTEG